MAAMAWPRARPNVLHPRQYGGINLERAYSIRKRDYTRNCEIIIENHHSDYAISDLQCCNSNLAPFILI